MLVLPTKSTTLSSNQQGLTAGVSALPKLLQHAPASCSKKGDGRNTTQAMQRFSIGQCRNLAKMLANSGNNQLCVKSGEGVSSRSTPSSNFCPQVCSHQVPKCKNADVHRNMDTCRDAKSSLKQNQRLRAIGRTTSGQPGGDELTNTSSNKDACNRQYFDQLLKSVDKAIASQYSTSNDQGLTFAEISAALERVERRFFNRVAAAKAEKQHFKPDIKREGSGSICKFCIAASKRAKLNDSSVFGGVTESSSIASIRSDNGGGMAGEVSSSSFSLVSNPSSMVPAAAAAGGSKVGEANKQLLLSRSEERMLLRDLERDAHKVSLNLLSYLRRAGEGIADCLRTPNIIPFTIV